MPSNMESGLEIIGITEEKIRVVSFSTYGGEGVTTCGYLIQQKEKVIREENSISSLVTFTASGQLNSMAFSLDVHSIVKKASSDRYAFGALAKRNATRSVSKSELPRPLDCSHFLADQMSICSANGSFGNKI